MDSNYMQIGLKMCEMLWLCQVFCRLNCFFLTLWCTLWKEKLECCDKPNRITWTHVTGNFSGGLGGLEGDSIQPQVIARCLHLLPRRLVNFLHGKRISNKSQRDFGFHTFSDAVWESFACIWDCEKLPYIAYLLGVDFGSDKVRIIWV